VALHGDGTTAARRSAAGTSSRRPRRIGSLPHDRGGARENGPLPIGVPLRCLWRVALTPPSREITRGRHRDVLSAVAGRCDRLRPRDVRLFQPWRSVPPMRARTAGGDSAEADCTTMDVFWRGGRLCGAGWSGAGGEDAGRVPRRPESRDHAYSAIAARSPSPKRRTMVSETPPTRFVTSFTGVSRDEGKDDVPGCRSLR
jgi:hypothetical protein